MSISEILVPLLRSSNISIGSETSSSSFIPSCALNIEKEVKGKKWNTRALDVLDKWEINLEKNMPNNLVQKEVDKFGVQIQKLLKPAEKFNKWLESKGQGAWYTKLAIFLGKLPIRAVRNILQLVYCIIKATIYTFVHPIKTLFDAAKLLIQFIDSLTKPETYTKVGAGVLGASLGQLAVTGGFGPHAYIGLAIGGALLLGGLTTGVILAAVEADKGKGLCAAGEELWKQAKSISETMLTGFIMGVIFGAIQRTVVETKAKPNMKVTDDASAREFLRQHNLEPPDVTHIEYWATRYHFRHEGMGRVIFTHTTPDPYIKVWYLNHAGHIRRPISMLEITISAVKPFTYQVHPIPASVALATGTGAATISTFEKILTK